MADNVGRSEHGFAEGESLRPTISEVSSLDETSVSTKEIAEGTPLFPLASP